MKPTSPTAVPEAALAAAEHLLGDPQARLSLLEYGGYECPACARVEPLIHKLLAASGAPLCFVFRHLPLMEEHPHAELAAEAAEAAAAQGQFWPMHHLLFTQHQALDLPALAACALAIGLDMLRFNAEMADRIYTQRVQEHRRAAESSGIRSTPTFLLNGKRVDVSAGFDRLERAVASALKGR
jgi:protein-disulfide isomerase